MRVTKTRAGMDQYYESLNEDQLQEYNEQYEEYQDEQYDDQ